MRRVETRDHRLAVLEVGEDSAATPSCDLPPQTLAEAIGCKDLCAALALCRSNWIERAPVIAQGHLQLLGARQHHAQLCPRLQRKRRRRAERDREDLPIAGDGGAAEATQDLEQVDVSPSARGEEAHSKVE